MTPSHARPALALVTVEAGAASVDVDGAAHTSTGVPATADTPFHFCSAAKALTAVGTIILASQGVLDLDAGVGHVLPGAAPDAPEPTLRQLLAHRGGIVDPPEAFVPAAVTPDVGDVLAGRHIAGIPEVRVRTTPGTAESYSDGGYCVVEAVVEAATGASFADVMHGVLFAPLGLERTAFWGGEVTAGARSEVVGRIAGTAARGHDAAGTPTGEDRRHYPGLAASGLWSSPADIAEVLADLGRALAGEESVLLTPAQAETWSTPWPGTATALGVWRIAQDGTHPWVMTQGWGEGFQCQLRWYPTLGRSVAAVMNADPGAPQEASAIGRAIAGAMRPPVD